MTEFWEGGHGRRLREKESGIVWKDDITTAYHGELKKTNLMGSPTLEEQS